MDKYLKNLIPRLKEFGRTLNAKESFVDKTWNLAETGEKLTIYRFLRSGKLLVSTSGIVNEFLWEYIPPDSLYLKLSNEGIMLRHGFIFEAILVMNIEGSPSNTMIFYDEKEIPNGDLISYIMKKLINQFGFKNIGEKYIIRDQDNQGLGIGTEVLNKDLELATTKGIKINDKYYTLQNGIVTNCEVKKEFETQSGKIFIRFDAISGELKHGYATDETGMAANGEYKIINNSIRKITVNKGHVIDYQYTWYLSPIAGFIFVILFVFLIILFLIFLTK